MKLNTRIEVVKRILNPWKWRIQSISGTASIDNSVLPRMWNDIASRRAADKRVFCTIVVDVFDPSIPRAWRAALFDLISQTSNLDWLLPTRFMGNVAGMLPERMGAVLPNAWIGAIVSNQEEADRDIPVLLRVPVVNRFVSIESPQGAVDLSPWLDLIQYEDGAPWGRRNIGHLHDMLDWVIVGGGAQPMHPNWVISLRDQCAAADVPFLFKGWGEFVPRSNCYHVFEDGLSASDRDPTCEKWPNVIRLTEAGLDGHRLENSDGQGDDCYMQQVGRTRAGRLLKGEIHNGVPA